MKQILIVDDEKNMCEALKILLEGQNYSVATAENGQEAIERVKNGEFFDLIISDLKMPGLDGMGVLNYLRDNNYSVPLVFITAYGTIESAVEAMKKGASDFITKPFKKDVIVHVIDRVLKMEDLYEENRHLKEAVRNGDLIFKSDSMKRIMKTVVNVAAAPTPVLLTGESGCGKGLIAEEIHRLGPGEEEPFVEISCPAIPETLMESELFGYRRGAFTGADSDFKGRIRASEGGTLFLDEVADIPLSVQAKLLRILEEKRFEPLGSTTTITINNRVICATNKNLQRLVREGRFREDLYYRINTITLDIPPLRERTADIIPLAEFFLEQSRRKIRKDISGISDQVQEALCRYRWPGNVRELRNVIERAVVLSQHRFIEAADLPDDIRDHIEPAGNVSNEKNRHDRLASAERSILEEALEEHRGNISAAAEALGVSRSTLRYRIKKYGLHTGRY
ncbi:MAG TPA: sigma-54-dependent Fis family transcriptional regulator [Sediminispirochaeta sp.]|nr:sigma-54-dependent Fis family transcriptional regulator [Sediminispirochaeta sp.]